MANKKNVFIHPSSIVENPKAIGENTYIGPYCIIGKDVIIGKNNKFHSHVTIDGHTKIGDHNEVYPYASLGLPPQDIKYKNEPTELIIGNYNVLREHVTIHRATTHDKAVTRVGNNCFLMVGIHIAHDCEIGDHSILANNVVLGGHVSLGNNAIIGGLTAIHQFVRIGSYAMIGGVSAAGEDIPPFAMAYNNASSRSAKIMGTNMIGMKRNGFSREDIKSINQSFEVLYKSGAETVKERLVSLKNEKQLHTSAFDIFITFMSQPSKRGLCAGESQKYG